MFTEMAGNFVLLKRGGVFFQAEVAKCTLNDRVYAKVGRGYVRLGTSDSTSSPKITRCCDYREAPNVVVRDRYKGPEFI